MERRNRSLEALNKLSYIDSLESYSRADALVKWYNEYLDSSDISTFDLELEDLKKLLELFYKNIDFLKKHKVQTRKDIITNQKMKKFLNQ